MQPIGNKLMCACVCVWENESDNKNISLLIFFWLISTSYVIVKKKVLYGGKKGSLREAKKYEPVM